ncbi:MAG: transglutaminase-like cysteine peptidase [Magnetococcales bacterium]|nr:transglutaminase-like cysteine peptidase [Magnetococcales bacterium]
MMRVLWLLLLCCSMTIPAVAAVTDPTAWPQLFRDSLQQQDPSGRSHKLAQVMVRHDQHRPASWITDLLAVRELPVLKQLQTVQTVVNQRMVYRDDPDNVWQAPVEAYRAGGDCEDYAIAKLLLLREAGFPERDMRLVTLGQATADQVYHVILVVRWQGQVYVLDSPRRHQAGQAGHGQITPWSIYRDASRPVVWAGWSGGAAHNLMRDNPRHPACPSCGPVVSFRQFPAAEKLVRIAADLLVIHPWEPPLTAREIEHLRRLRHYFAEPTPENAGLISSFEMRKLDELRRHQEAAGSMLSSR